MSNMPNVTPAWPVEIRLVKDRRALHVTFEDGNTFTLSAELLRVTSPSAEVQGHSEAQRKTVGGKRNVTILSVDPVGNYAVRLGFDDMHSTGIYSWAWTATGRACGEARGYFAWGCFRDFVSRPCGATPKSSNPGTPGP
jgi:DUF971 family protein